MNRPVIVARPADVPALRHLLALLTVVALYAHVSPLLSAALWVVALLPLDRSTAFSGPARRKPAASRIGTRCRTGCTASPPAVDSRRDVAAPARAHQGCGPLVLAWASNVFRPLGGFATPLPATRSAAVAPQSLAAAVRPLRTCPAPTIA